MSVGWGEGEGGGLPATRGGGGGGRASSFQRPGGLEIDGANRGGGGGGGFVRNIFCLNICLGDFFFCFSGSVFRSQIYIDFCFQRL